MEGERVVVAMFASAADAQHAIKNLREAGFSENAIGLLTHDREGGTEMTAFRELEGNHAPKGAAIGAAAGAGGGALWALGVAAGFLPAIGPIIAGGVFVALAASAAAGAGAGAVVGTLVGLGVTDEEAAYFDDAFRKGNTVVTVHDDPRIDLARTILSAHGAQIRQVVTPTRLGDQVAAELRR